MEDTAPFVTAIIVAAGGSTRMGGEISKQFLPIMGMPVIGRTLSAFEAAGCIDDVVVVTREEDMLDRESILEIVRNGVASQIDTGSEKGISKDDASVK